MNWHWYNNSGAAKAISTNSGGVYTYWFTGASGTGSQISTTVYTGQASANQFGAGLSGPAAGDVIYWDSNTAAGAASFSPILSWTGVQIAAGQTIYLGVMGAFNLDATSQIGAGSAIYYATGSVAPMSIAATWLGDIAIGNSPATGNLVTLGAGWQVNGGAAGGSITMACPGVTISPPAAGQVKSFNNINLTSGTQGISATGLGSAASPITITGGYTYAAGTGTYTQPSGKWIILSGTLNAATGVFTTATAGACGVGQVPNVSNVLPNDGVFGYAGTSWVPTAANVAAAVPTAAAIATAAAAAVLKYPQFPLVTDSLGYVTLDPDFAGAMEGTIATYASIAILANPGNKLATDANGNVAASNMVAPAPTAAAIRQEIDANSNKLANAVPTPAQIASAVAAPSTAAIAAAVAAAVAAPSAAAVADAVKAINIDSTGGQAVSAAKCLEVLLSRAIGDATYDPAAAVNTLLGRDGATPLASIKLTGSGNRQQSTIN